jgi:hypothetical protein
MTQPLGPMSALLRTPLRATLAAGAAVLLALFALGWWVLESSGVAVVETRSADGGTRSTHVWYVMRDAELWLEAGTPENGWYLDIQHSPILKITIGEASQVRRAVPVPDRSVQREIRALLRAKYGVRDELVGVFVDSSGSVAVRLSAADPPPDGARATASDS